LRNIFRALKPNGVYLCFTPNRLSGPHDVSRDFDAVATGLHLKEYTVTELDKIFRQTGFSRTRIYFRFRAVEVFLPTFPYKMAEAVLGALPHSIRKLITFNRAVRFLLGVKLVGTK
jgi:SAM-dependent methyltransferase